MRAFIAINCPKELLENVGKAQADLKAFGDLKLVEKENLHITLRFLGEIDQAKAEAVKERLSLIKYPSFNLSLEGVGVFPSPGSARVIWIGAREGCREATELAGLVESSLDGLGFEEEKRFHCHLTLGRARSIRDRQGLMDYLRANNEASFGSFSVDRIDLMESRLSRTGPAYSSVQGYMLGPRRQ